jgi:acyl-CoA synthetase (AMP-forming)/AMP-acid ligase II
MISLHAKKWPYRHAVTFSSASPHCVDERAITYQELDHAAREIAVALRKSCEPGDRALLVGTLGLEFVKSFVGCLYAGVIPVIAPLPSGKSQHLDRATGVALDADVRVVLTDAESFQLVGDWQDQDGLKSFATFVTNAMMFGDAAEWQRVPRDRDGVVLLQYTAESASDPHGVMVTHGNLMHNLAMLQESMRLSPDSKFCGWLPMYQPFGVLLQLLLPLYLGATTVLMPPMDFVKNPYRWLELISRHEVDTSFAPDFSYDLCVRRVTDEQLSTLDLSRWVNAGVRGTPRGAQSMARFAERFGDAGFHLESFCLGYGSTEATLLVTGARQQWSDTVREVDPRLLEAGRFEPAGSGLPVSRGGLVRGLDVRIVDPCTRVELPAGAVGEVWIRGQSVTKGYWGRAHETSSVFRAVTADGEREFLRTGDLGAFHHGELYLAGRLDEVIRIDGRTLYPAELEQIAGEYVNGAGLAGAAFTVPSEQQEIVVLHEFAGYGEQPEDCAALADDIRVALGRELGMWVRNFVFVRPGVVRTMLDGNVRRALMRDLFLADALNPLYEKLDDRTRRRYRLIPPVGARV